jgi:branched-chain amino acid aminotransferase
MSDLIHFLNGKFVKENELLISPRDLGYVRGYAVNDYIVTFNNKPFKVDEHVDRLFLSAEILALQIPWSKNEIATWINDTFEKNDKDTEKTLKVIISGGVSNSMYQSEPPTIVMIASHYIEKPPSYYENGVKAKVVKHKRPYPEAKHTYHAETIRQLALSKGEGVSEVIFYDDTQVFEAGGSNLFAVINNRLVTPETEIVFGIIRKTLLEILNLSMTIEVRNFTLDELHLASEVFITNSRNGSIGVVKLNGKLVGDGKVGEITNTVSKQYKEYISRLD